MSNAEMILNNEKAFLARYILEIESAELLARVKKSLSAFITLPEATPVSRTEKVLNMIAGKWEDNTSADQMKADIYASRNSELENWVTR